MQIFPERNTIFSGNLFYSYKFDHLSTFTFIKYWFYNENKCLDMSSDMADIYCIICGLFAIYCGYSSMGNNLALQLFAICSYYLYSLGIVEIINDNVTKGVIEIGGLIDLRYGYKFKINTALTIWVI